MPQDSQEVLFVAVLEEYNGKVFDLGLWSLIAYSEVFLSLDSEA